MANILLAPFVKLKFSMLGVESVNQEFVNLMRKVCIQGSFHHSFDNTYVLYDLFNGVYFRENKYNEHVLSASKYHDKKGTMTIHRLELENIKAFERFCKDIENNHSSISERWTLNYKDKRINSIVCTLNIIPDHINHKNRKIDAIKMGIVFDHEFNVVSIVKQYFVTIRSKHGDDTFEMPVSKSIIEGQISLDTEFLLINLATATDNSPLMDMFPEYFMTTVYDYSSIEFEQRLQLYNMVSY
jgi:hypothetical protein